MRNERSRKGGGEEKKRGKDEENPIAMNLRLLCIEADLVLTDPL